MVIFLEECYPNRKRNVENVGKIYLHHDVKGGTQYYKYIYNLISVRAQQYFWYI